MAEEWKLQVSYKTPAGDMINVRAQTADELSVLLSHWETTQLKWLLCSDW